MSVLAQGDIGQRRVPQDGVAAFPVQGIAQGPEADPVLHPGLKTFDEGLRIAAQHLQGWPDGHAAVFLPANRSGIAVHKAKHSGQGQQAGEQRNQERRAAVQPERGCSAEHG